MTPWWWKEEELPGENLVTACLKSCITLRCTFFFSLTETGCSMEGEMYSIHKNIEISSWQLGTHNFLSKQTWLQTPVPPSCQPYWQWLTSTFIDVGVWLHIWGECHVKMCYINAPYKVKATPSQTACFASERQCLSGGAISLFLFWKIAATTGIYWCWKLSLRTDRHVTLFIRWPWLCYA